MPLHLDIRQHDARSMYRLLSGLVVPRPIAWVSSMDAQGGINLAPFSFFNLVGSDPALVVLGIGDGPDGHPKHTAQNILTSREFVVNLVTEELAHPMNLTAAEFPRGHSELEAAGLHPGPSIVVKVPRVLEAPASLECLLHTTHRIGANNLIIGEVVALHVADNLVDERFHVHDFHPIARLGGALYSRTVDRFELPRPKLPPAQRETEGDS